MVLFLPLAGLATVLLPVAAAGKFLAESDELVRIMTTSVLAAFPVLLAYFVGRIKTIGTRFAKILGWIQVNNNIFTDIYTMIEGFYCLGKFIVLPNNFAHAMFVKWEKCVGLLQITTHFIPPNKVLFLTLLRQVP